MKKFLLIVAFVMVSVFPQSHVLAEESFSQHVGDIIVGTISDFGFSDETGMFVNDVTLDEKGKEMVSLIYGLSIKGQNSGDYTDILVPLTVEASRIVITSSHATGFVSDGISAGGAFDSYVGHTILGTVSDFGFSDEANIFIYDSKFDSSGKEMVSIIFGISIGSGDRHNYVLAPMTVEASRIHVKSVLD
ncbi:hypothetical protein IC620_14560 [Hazenella sp. IB182357]|uniref:Uncharacterized protein n=1 Tax=Polycladospora coralii TaxID=2771432 RepID=A0A926NBK5_9BACL|nr:hypothetical protein [Polycladospora coralii]MBD1373567.1 hypothetical protein [Polycladospora coralii]MBS7531940.1 hypothetical protein [Polycladospora coralii]